MADILAVLQALGGEGATLIKGTISAVSTGRLTVNVNGGTFDRVPYMQGGWTPTVGQQVYLLHQERFGTLALGSPVAPAADGTLPAQALMSVAPTARANWTARTSSWEAVGSDGLLTQRLAYKVSGAWFYPAASFTPWAATELASVEIQLLLDSGTGQLALHRNEALTGEPVILEGPLTVTPEAGVATWVPLPLSWGRALLDGSALGIAAWSQAFDADFDLHGTLRFTSL